MKKLLAIIMLAAPAVAVAQAYRWVDKDGVVHYTQVPPPGGTKYETARPAPPPQASPNQDALNKSLAQSIKEEPKKKQEAQQAAVDEERRQQECKGFRDQLAAIDNTPPARLSQTDEQGNVSRVTEDQLQQRRGQIQQAIRDRCG